MGLGRVARKRWKTAHFRHAFGVGLVAIAMGGILASLIQQRFSLYSSAFTMTVVGMAATVVGVVILWLLDKHRYAWAWAAAIALPPAVYLGFMRVLEAHLPTPPLG